MKSESVKPRATGTAGGRGGSSSLSDGGRSALAQADSTSSRYTQEAERHDCRVSGHSSISHVAL